MHRIGKMLLIILAAGAVLSFSQTKKRADWEDGRPIGCTTITVGRLASADGSVIASGTTDSGRTRGIFGMGAKGCDLDDIPTETDVYQPETPPDDPAVFK